MYYMCRTGSLMQAIKHHVSRFYEHIYIYISKKIGFQSIALKYNIIVIFNESYALKERVDRHNN